MLNKAYSSYTIVDVTDGLNWLGELAEAPSPAKQSDAYYNTKEKKSYFYDGTGWVVFSYDAPEGRNYLLESNKLIVNSLYSPHSYKLSTKPEGGAVYTVTLKGELGSPHKKFKIYNTVGEAGMVDLIPKGDNIHQATFNWVSGIDTALKIYVLPGDGDTTSVNRIEWIKMEKGSIATPWSPAPEDALVYNIMLSNDSTTIGTNKDGSGYTSETLQAVSQTEVKVFKGTEDITSKCTYSWTVSNKVQESTDIGNMLNTYAGNTVYFTKLDKDTATATVTVKLGSDVIGTKTFTISKNKQGVPGANGTTPHVGDNGNWYIGTTDTGITAQGPAGSDGKSPYIKDGNWWIGNADTGVAAKGPQGNDGKGIKSQVYNTAIRTFTYYHNSSSQTPSVEKPVKPTADSTSGEGDWPWKTYCTQMWWTTTYTNNITETSTSTYSPWSEWELACTNASDVKAFNTLTNNGQFKGHYYGVYVWTNGKRAYFNDPLEEDSSYTGYTKYLIQPKDSDISKNLLRIDVEGKRVDTGGIEVQDNPVVPDYRTLRDHIDYYVNASMIQTGSLLVGTEDDPIFQAGFDKKSDGGHTVKIAGFDVNNTSLQSTKTGYIYLGTDAIKLGTKSGEHHPFEVNDQGEMYSISGEIGGWNINEVGLYNSTPEKQIYLKRIYYSFAQGTSLNQTVENAVSLTYQDSLINLSSYYPIFVKRTFDYGNFTLSTIAKMTIRTQQGIDTWITAYNIYYSNDKSVQLPLSVDNPGAFQRWSKWLSTRNELYDYICVDWSVGTDSGFDPLVPYDSGNSVSSSAGIVTLTDYRRKTSAYYFGCNSDENIQNSSLLDGSNSAIVFYAGGNILNLQEAAFQVLRDGSVYMKALQVDRLISKGQELNFGVVDKRISGNTYRSGITMYSGDTQLLTQSAYGFYIGFDGANFGQLYLSGKKVNIDYSDGHLYIIP